MPWKITGHELQIERFRKASRCGRLASTFLFVGPAGIGKRTFAEQLAGALLCQRSTADTLDACGNCTACQLVAAGSHPDLYLIAKPIDKSMLPLELLIGDREHRMKSGLCYQMSLKPRMGQKKVAILDDADHLNAEGANALLKLLEEPPPGSVIVLISTHASRQLPTIRSRAQLVRFQPLTNQQLAQLIQDQGFAESAHQALAMARAGRGSIERSRQLCDEETQALRGALHDALVQEHWRAQELVETVTSYVDAAGKDAPPRRQRLKNAIDFVVEFYRDQLHIACGCAVINQETRDEEIVPAGLSDFEYARCIDHSLRAFGHVDANANLPTLTEWWLNELSTVARPPRGA